MKTFEKLDKNAMKMIKGGTRTEAPGNGEGGCINKCNIDCPCEDSRDWCVNGLCKSRN